MKGHSLMPTIDRAYRPASYWDPADPRAAVLQNIKGQNRRNIVADRLGEGVDEELLADTLDSADRTALGAIHPSWMGGEYLPDYRPGEVEIARIVLASSTQDVISIRARRRGAARRILYRVVDEYETEIGFAPRSSAQPLTLGQLIGLIDSIDIGTGGGEGRTYIEETLRGLDDHAFEEIVAFVSVESVVYPGLAAHYRDEVERIASELLADAD